MATQELIRERREHVLRYLGNMLTPDQIVEHLHKIRSDDGSQKFPVAKRTVEEDIRVVREELGVALKNMSREELATEIWMKILEQQRLAVEMYHSPTATTADKKRAQDTMIRLLQMQWEMFNPKGIEVTQFNIAISGERCEKCPFREKFTNYELHEITNGVWEIDQATKEARKKVPELGLPSEN